MNPTRVSTLCAAGLLAAGLLGPVAALAQDAGPANEASGGREALTPPPPPPDVVVVPDVQPLAPTSSGPAAPVQRRTPPPGRPTRTASAQARTWTSRITWGPLPLVTGWLPFEYERAISPSVSLYLGPQIQPLGGLAALAGARMFGARLAVGARFFPMEPAPEGFWFGGELVPAYETSEMRIEGLMERNEAVSLAVLGMLGYTTILDNGFTASFGAGIGGGYILQTTQRGISPPGRAAFPSPNFALHLQIGYAL